MKHTPGPWEVGGWRGSDNRYKMGHWTVGIPHHASAIWVHGDYEPETQANARLIAAAPELLEACETALPLVRESLKRKCMVSITGGEKPDLTPLDILEKAIARARGERGLERTVHTKAARGGCI